LTVAAFVAKRNTRRRSDLTAGSEAGYERYWGTKVVLAGLGKPWTISSAIIVKVFHKVDSETEVSVTANEISETTIRTHKIGPPEKP
jgi:hypothetical protein